MHQANACDSSSNRALRAQHNPKCTRVCGVEGICICVISMFMRVYTGTLFDIIMCVSVSVCNSDDGGGAGQAVCV